MDVTLFFVLLLHVTAGGEGGAEGTGRRETAGGRRAQQPLQADIRKCESPN